MLGLREQCSSKCSQADMAQEDVLRKAAGLAWRASGHSGNLAFILRWEGGP